MLARGHREPDLLVRTRGVFVSGTLQAASLPWVLGSTVWWSLFLRSTVSGAIGSLMPLTSKEDIDFFTHLEMYIRTEGLSLIGRDHLSYRCAFAPVKVRVCVRVCVCVCLITLGSCMVCIWHRTCLCLCCTHFTAVARGALCLPRPPSPLPTFPGRG